MPVDVTTVLEGGHNFLRSPPYFHAGRTWTSVLYARDAFFVLFFASRQRTNNHRGAFPDLELESILRVSTAVISVMGLQRALLTLGHAVATVLDRESLSKYYR